MGLFPLLRALWKSDKYLNEVDENEFSVLKNGLNGKSSLDIKAKLIWKLFNDYEHKAFYLWTFVIHA